MPKKAAFYDRGGKRNWNLLKHEDQETLANKKLAINETEKKAHHKHHKRPTLHPCLIVSGSFIELLGVMCFTTTTGQWLPPIQPSRNK
jgi:hypothetical protein